jgi:hypothetical protein
MTATAAVPPVAMDANAMRPMGSTRLPGELVATGVDAVVEVVMTVSPSWPSEVDGQEPRSG